MKLLTFPLCRLASLLAFLMLATSNRADEVPLQNFEWDPMSPLQFLPGTTLPAGPVSSGYWWVAPGISSSLVQVVDTDAAAGAQGLLITRGAVGSQTRLELSYVPPLAGLIPVFVDFRVRPTSWSGSTGQQSLLPGSATEGAQIFVDGHFFAFQQATLNEALRLNFYDFVPPPGSSAWQQAPVSVPVPTGPRTSSTQPVSAKDWVRVTVRVDPVSARADVWLNGVLLITDAPRSAGYAPAYDTPLMGRPFYIQGSSNGPLGFDEFQATLTNPLFGDMDSDGLPDDWELAHGLNLSLNDRNLSADADTLTNLQELLLGTSPDNADTDGDGMPDDWENSFQSQALNPLSALDANQDVDFDGWSNLEEFLAGTDPLLNAVAPPNRTMIYVKPVTGSSATTQNGTFAYPFSTLAAAVAAAQSSSGPGTRTIEVIPNGGLALQGPGNVDLSIYAPQGGPVPILIRGNGVLLNGSAMMPPPVGTYAAAHFGLRIFSGSVTVEDVFFYLCAGFEGGAVFASGGNPADPVSLTLRRCSFGGCKAFGGFGGAVRCSGLAVTTVEECSFNGCSAPGKGGALSVEGNLSGAPGTCHPSEFLLTVRRCRFSSNNATGGGGAVHASYCLGDMENCLFTSNYTTASAGAAIVENGSVLTLRFCTLKDNSATVSGAALHNTSGGTPSVLNSCLLWNNLRGGILTVNTQASGPWTATCTTAQSQILPGSPPNNANDANDANDPLFFYGTSNLQPTSPAINSADAVHPLTDIDGNLRGTAADRGCSEFSDRDGDGMSDGWEAANGLNAANAADRDTDLDQDGFTNYEEWLARTSPVSASGKPAPAIYVNPATGSDTKTGAGIGLAVKSISRAIALCGNTTTMRICLMDGTYTGTLNRNLTTNPLISGTATPRKFYLKSINGKGRVTIDLADSARFLTIENAAWDGTCGLEGLTIRRGKVLYQTGVADSDNGGAILVKTTSVASQPFIARCTLAGSDAAGSGGAVFVRNGSLFLYQSELFANRATAGGALAVCILTGNHTVFGLDCTLAYNYATLGGGGAIWSAGSLCWKGGRIFRNDGVWGGAITLEGASLNPFSVFNSGTGAAFLNAPCFPVTPLYWQSQYAPPARPLLGGIRITDNDAWSSGEPDAPRGGALTVMNCHPLLEQLIVENNNAAGTSANDGGGLWCSLASPVLSACLFRGNQTVASGGAIATDGVAANGDEIFLAHCALCDNTAAADGGAIYAAPTCPGRQYWMLHCTLTYNRSNGFSVSTVSAGENITGNWAWMANCLVYYNRTSSGTVAGMAPSTRDSPESTGNDIENPATPVNAWTGPALAWDHYHVVNPNTLTGTSLIPGNASNRDIDGELRLNTAANPPERGCDEWTDSNSDGIPDWYAKLIADLSATDAVTVATTDLGARKLWGAGGPTVSQMASLGWNPLTLPVSNAPTADPDGDGLTNAQEFAAGTSALLADSDGDGWADLFEILFQRSPTSAPVPRPAGPAGLVVYSPGAHPLRRKVVLP